MNGLRVFQSHQILCLEHKSTHLYVEVIQVATVRQSCWVRPLVLVTSPHPSPTDAAYKVEPALPILYDLRQGADLLWSADCFRVALDTEVIPLLAQLGDSKIQPEHDQLARQQLHNLMKQVWQAQNCKPLHG